VVVTGLENGRLFVDAAAPSGMEIGRINAGNTGVMEPVRSTSVPHHLLSGTGADCGEVQPDVDQ